MTADELISGLRKRGYTIHRSSGPGWVIIPRVKPDDPVIPWSQELGGRVRDFQPEKWSKPDLLEYEVTLQTCRVELEPLEGEGPDDPAYKTRMQGEIWRAAA